MAGSIILRRLASDRTQERMVVVGKIIDALLKVLAKLLPAKYSYPIGFISIVSSVVFKLSGFCTLRLRTEVQRTTNLNLSSL